MAIKSVKAVINGTTYNLTLDSSSGTYKATLVAPAESSYPLEGHYYPVKVTAEDTAGNTASADDKDPTLGASLRLRVLEKDAPTITATYPTDGARIITSTPKITWTVLDSGSGVDPSTLALTLNGVKITSGITAKPISGGYACEYTPTAALGEGNNAVAFDAADFDGNRATQVSVTFAVDTVAPTLNVSEPAEGLSTNEPACTVAGTTNDATSSPVSVSIKLNNVDQGTVTVGSSGAFSKVLTLNEGQNTIEVTATDQAGKATTVTRHVELDTHAPVISGVTITTNPADSGKTLIISVTVTDA